MTDAEPTFEEALARLEAILRRLEQGNVSLDEALELWRDGEALHRRCAEILGAAEARIVELERSVDDKTPPSG